MSTVTIAGRFNGPPTSANGGYACGCVAGAIAGPGTVRLASPPPLDRPLKFSFEDERVALIDGETTIASGTPGSLEWNAPDAPTLAEAEEAPERFVAYETHAFPTCFVCGPAREPNDGLRLFPGAVTGRDLVACAWTPSPQDVSDGAVDPRIVWAALDCPSFFGLAVSVTHPFLLGQMTADVPARLLGDRRYVVYGWRRGEEGRKHFGASAIADETGRVLARAEHVWFDMKGRV